MPWPPYAANEYATDEYRRIFLEPMTAVMILETCVPMLLLARQLLDDEDPSRSTQHALLHLDAARHHLRQALGRLPTIGPDEPR